MKTNIRRVHLQAGSWLTIVFTALVALMLWKSFALSPSSAWMPRVILAITMLLLLSRLAVEGVGGREKSDSVDQPGSQRAFMAMAWIGGLLIAAWLLGAAPGCALFCAAWLRWHAGESWLVSLLPAAILGLSLWLLFAFLLGASLYPGVLLPLLG